MGMKHLLVFLLWSALEIKIIIGFNWETRGDENLASFH